MIFLDHWYTLDKDKNVIPILSIEELKNLDEKIRRVRVNRIKKYDVVVSTVFLGLNHNFYGSTLPVVFETMIFWNDKEKLDPYCERYCTWEEALKGHRSVLRKLIKELRNREEP